MKFLLDLGGWFYVLFGGINFILSIIGIITKQGYSMMFRFDNTYQIATNLFTIFCSIIIILSGVSCFLSKKNFKGDGE